MLMGMASLNLQIMGHLVLEKVLANSVSFLMAIHMKECFKQTHDWFHVLISSRMC